MKKVILFGLLFIFSLSLSAKTAKQKRREAIKKVYSEKLAIKKPSQKEDLKPSTGKKRSGWQKATIKSRLQSAGGYRIKR